MIQINFVSTKDNQVDALKEFKEILQKLETEGLVKDSSGVVEDFAFDETTKVLSVECDSDKITDLEKFAHAFASKIAASDDSDAKDVSELMPKGDDYNREGDNFSIIVSASSEKCKEILEKLPIIKKEFDGIIPPIEEAKKGKSCRINFGNLVNSDYETEILHAFTSRNIDIFGSNRDRDEFTAQSVANFDARETPKEKKIEDLWSLMIFYNKISEEGTITAHQEKLFKNYKTEYYKLTGNHFVDMLEDRSKESFSDWDWEKANKKVHKVEDQWHYPILTKYGFKPETKEAQGLVRNYIYKNEGTEIKCVTGASSDYWEVIKGEKGGGYHGSLEVYLKEHFPSQDKKPMSDSTIFIDLDPKNFINEQASKWLKEVSTHLGAKEVSGSYLQDDDLEERESDTIAHWINNVISRSKRIGTTKGPRVGPDLSGYTTYEFDGVKFLITKSDGDILFDKKNTKFFQDLFETPSKLNMSLDTNDLDDLEDSEIEADEFYIVGKIEGDDDLQVSEESYLSEEDAQDQIEEWTAEGFTEVKVIKGEDLMEMNDDEDEGEDDKEDTSKEEIKVEDVPVEESKTEETPKQSKPFTFE